MLKHFKVDVLNSSEYAFPGKGGQLILNQGKIDTGTLDGSCHLNFKGPGDILFKNSQILGIRLVHFSQTRCPDQGVSGGAKMYQIGRLENASQKWE